MRKWAIHSPTPTAASVRLLLTIAVHKNWAIKFTDVSTAFLHAVVIGNPYVYPPDTDKLGNTNKVWQLKKALYGLKSAPKAWNNHITSVLERTGWARSQLGECVYSKSKDLKKQKR